MRPATRLVQIGGPDENSHLQTPAGNALQKQAAKISREGGWEKSQAMC
jgi:hypothetical protein